MGNLYDTCVFIDYWQGDDDADVLIKSAMKNPNSVSYSPISVVELWQSSQLERQEEIEFEALAQHFLQNAGLSNNVAKKAGQSLLACTRSQRMTLAADSIIAVTAEERGDKVITRNIRDIKKFYSDVEAY